MYIVNALIFELIIIEINDIKFKLKLKIYNDDASK